MIIFSVRIFIPSILVPSKLILPIYFCSSERVDYKAGPRNSSGSAKSSPVGIKGHDPTFSVQHIEKPKISPFLRGISGEAKKEISRLDGPKATADQDRLLQGESKHQYLLDGKKSSTADRNHSPEEKTDASFNEPGRRNRLVSAPPALSIPDSKQTKLQSEDPSFDFDNEILVQTLLHRTTLTSTLSTRLTHLQLLGSMWAEGNLTGVLSLLRKLHESNREDRTRYTIVADFLRVVDLRTQGITLDWSLQIFPVLSQLLSLDFENHVMVGMRSIDTLLNMFGHFVKQAKGTSYLGGVDIQGDERQAKCNRFTEFLLVVDKQLTNILRVFPRDSSVQTFAMRLQEDLGSFLGI